MKLKKKIPLIDQHDKFGMWGDKFGGNFVPETLKKPIKDLELLFAKSRNNKRFIEERDKYFIDWIGTPTLEIMILFWPSTTRVESNSGHNSWDPLHLTVGME